MFDLLFFLNCCTIKFEKFKILKKVVTLRFIITGSLSAMFYKPVCTLAELTNSTLFLTIAIRFQFLVGTFPIKTNKIP